MKEIEKNREGGVVGLTAREWLILPQEEQKKRKNELSSHECFLLRTELAYIHFSEDEKINMSEEKKELFLHPKEYTEDERKAFNQQCHEIFKKLSEESINGNLNI